MNAVHPSQAPQDAVPSTAAIGGHPVHPMLVPFPIAFLSGALVTDLIFVSLPRDQLFWAQCSYWLLVAGLFTGILAAIFGLTDFLGDRRVRSLSAAKLHLGGNATVLILAMINLWQRSDDIVAGLYPEGLALSALCVVILVGTGWLGGELAYRHRVGVMARVPEHRSPRDMRNW